MNFTYALLLDETEWRNFVVWLENQKLRNYKIEERAALCKIDSLEWPEAFRKYLGDLDCDLDDEALASRLTVCDWLLNQAMHFEFSDELPKQPAEAAAVSVGDVEMSDVIAKPKESANPLDYLDFDSDEFRARTRKLCELLQIAPYSDPKEELKAACLLITERLNSANIERFKLEYGKVKVGLLPLEQVQATLAEITREAEAPAQVSFFQSIFCLNNDKAC